MKSDEEIILGLTAGSSIYTGWVKRLPEALKRRLDRLIMTNDWRLEKGKKEGEYVIVAGRPTQAIIELRMKNGENHSDYIIIG